MYVIVFNMEWMVGDELEKTRCFEYLDFWVNSVAIHTCDEKSVSAPIAFVATSEVPTAFAAISDVPTALAAISLAVIELLTISVVPTAFASSVETSAFSLPMSAM